jgi:hypothetical protein
LFQLVEAKFELAYLWSDIFHINLSYYFLKKYYYYLDDMHTRNKGYLLKKLKHFPGASIQHKEIVIKKRPHQNWQNSEISGKNGYL